MMQRRCNTCDWRIVIGREYSVFEGRLGSVRGLEGVVLVLLGQIGPDIGITERDTGGR